MLVSKQIGFKTHQESHVMIGKLNHIAIAVPNLSVAAKAYETILGATVSEKKVQKEHGVTVIFVTLPNTKVELMAQHGTDSPLKKFLEKNPSGGIHHICYEVEDIIDARSNLISKGYRVLGSGTPKIGAHGKPVIFLNPKDFFGTLIELEQS